LPSIISILNHSLKKKLIVAIFLVLSSAVAAQLPAAASDTRYVSIGASSKHYTDPFSGAVNQAALAQVQHPGAGVYGSRLFMLKELSSYIACIALPVKKGGLGLVARYFGGSYYNQSQLGIGYGRTLHPVLDIGIQFNYNRRALTGYGSNSSLSVEAGLLIHISTPLHIGIHIYQPAAPKYGIDKSEQYSSVLTTGIGYEASDKLFISADFVKEQGQSVAISTAMQYIFARQLFTRLGITGTTGNYFFGLGVQWKNYRVDINSSWHARLGFSPGIMIIFCRQPTSQQDEAQK